MYKFYTYLSISKTCSIAALFNIFNKRQRPKATLPLLDPYIGKNIITITK